MLYWALVFLVVAIIAGALGFGGIAGTSAGVAQILFFIFLAFLVISLWPDCSAGPDQRLYGVTETGSRTPQTASSGRRAAILKGCAVRQNFVRYLHAQNGVRNPLQVGSLPVRPKRLPARGTPYSGARRGGPNHYIEAGGRHAHGVRSE